MQQLTGQEMDHQLDRISNIFENAKIRENPLFCIFLWYGWLIFGLIGFIGIYFKRRLLSKKI